MGLNMRLDPHLSLGQLPLFWDGLELRSPNPEKPQRKRNTKERETSRPSTKLYSRHSALRQRSPGIRQTQISQSKSQIEKSDSSHSKEQVCTAPERSTAACFTPLQPKLGILLGMGWETCVQRSWEPVPRGSRRTVLVLTAPPEAVWFSVVSEATDDSWFFTCWLAPLSPDGDLGVIPRSHLVSPEIEGWTH
ncbi:hypothetical protein NHX12_019653 [Muraenolepis orangiensis]|uniref:Uncharacterized protein n=1 Tax=Muraenolepis orangiensis TaxID=630683 RepID=A0A9Q0IW91_9TELE|nr:hypothetical protein NHX12_019653 [Muraenolepis orangiensis]